MRVCFLGTPEFGVPSLKALIENGYDVVGVFTQPDRPKGRGNKLQMSPVKECALRYGIPVFQPVKIKTDGVADLKALKPDLCVTAAFGQILSQEILDIPTLGTVNVHSSLLPKYRGSSPINWAIIKGERVTGVTTMFTDKGLDTGDILLQEETGIGENENATELTARLSEIGAGLLIRTIKAIEDGSCIRHKQDEAQMSYYPMLKKEMGDIDWNESSGDIVNKVRGLSDWPGTYTTLGGEMFKIHKAVSVQDNSQALPGTVLKADGRLIIKAGQNAVEILEMQMQGGKRMRAKDYLLGHTLKAGRCEKGSEV